jgi:branched-chain amino acid transport system permease protein
VAVAIPVLAPDHLALAAQVAITGLFALSLDLLVGYAGILSLGHAAFFGIGAYGAGLAAAAGWGEPLTGLLIAGAAAGLAGALASVIVVRLRHLQQIVVTLGIGLVAFEAAGRLPGLTGGDDGLQGISVWPVLGLFPFDLWGRTAYAYALGTLALGFALTTRLVHSPFGLALRGLRDNPRRMVAIGVPAEARLRQAHAMAAILAGVAGGLLTQTTQFVGVDVLSFSRSADVLVMLVLGGPGRRYGGLIGAAVYVVARDQLAAVDPRYWMGGLGIVLVVVVLFAPGGVLGGLARLTRPWRTAPP